MKPEFMRLRRTLALAATSLLAATGLVVVAAPSAASAHHNTVGVSVECVDESWQITWTIENSEDLQPETITESNHVDLVPIGTTIAGGEIFIVSETTDVRLTKTLSVTGHWAESDVTDSTGSATVYASSFDDDCVPPAPVDDPDGEPDGEGDSEGEETEPGSSSGDDGSYTPGDPDDESSARISASATPCVFDGEPLGSVSVSLTGLVVDHAYTLDLVGPAGLVESTGFLATTSSYATAFTALPPGSYTVTLSSAYSVVLGTTAPVTIDDCTPPIEPPPVETPPTITLQADPCLGAPGGSAASVTVQLGVLVTGNSYRVDLVSGGVVIASQSFLATGATNIVHFTGLAAGLYSATVTTPDVSPFARAATLSASSEPVALDECEDLPTLAPPTIEASTASCDVSDTAHRTVVVTLGDLDVTKNYYVTIVDSTNALVPGGEEQPVSGVASASLAFTGIAAPGAYTAVLTIDPGRQVAAVTQALLQLPSCSLPDLPTLALTGPGDVLPLGALGGALILLGGALTMGGLRRRATQ